MGGFGYNAATGDYLDLTKAGIIDPLARRQDGVTALTNAASVAGLMLTTNCLISELKDEAEPVTGSVN